MTTGNRIENVCEYRLSKKDLISAIERTFHSSNDNDIVCMVVETKMTDGTRNQTVTFGKNLL